MLLGVARCLVMMVVLLLTITVAEAGRGDAFFADLVRDLSPVNARGKVDLLAARIKDGRVTIEDFSSYYFRKHPGVRGTPQYRKKWERNMRINFSIINHEKKRNDPGKEIMARRAVELTLYRLQDDAPQAGESPN